jgi:hypothetical protein
MATESRRTRCRTGRGRQCNINPSAESQHDAVGRARPTRLTPSISGGDERELKQAEASLNVLAGAVGPD